MIHIILPGIVDEWLLVSFKHLPRPGDRIEYRIDTRKEQIAGVVDRLVFRNNMTVNEWGQETEDSEVQVYLKDVVRTPL